MKKVFKNTRLICIFTDEGISLYGGVQEAFYPYGSITSVHVDLLGVLRVNTKLGTASFVTDREDRPAMKDAVREAKVRAKNAEPEEAKIYARCSKVSDSLPAEEQLAAYKNLFVTGTISKGYYDLKKRLLKD